MGAVAAQQHVRLIPFLPDAVESRNQEQGGQRNLEIDVHQGQAAAGIQIEVLDEIDMIDTGNLLDHAGVAQDDHVRKSQRNAGKIGGHVENRQERIAEPAS